MIQSLRLCMRDACNACLDEDMVPSRALCMNCKLLSEDHLALVKILRRKEPQVVHSPLMAAVPISLAGQARFG